MNSLPVIDERIDDIPRWHEANATRVDKLLADQGAVLFRGSGFDTVERFRLLARSACRGLVHANPEHVEVDHSGEVHTPVAFPASRKLLWHNENTFNRDWPTRLLFGSAVPARAGGQTTTVDGRVLLDRLPKEVLEPFLRHGIQYVRRLGLDVGLDWRRVYDTDDPADVDRRCRAEDVRCEWSAGGELLTTFQVRPAVVEHPDTGERVWVGQPLHWHPAALGSDLYADLVSLYGEDGLPRDCRYGNGQPIPAEDVACIAETCAQIEDPLDWQRGDALLVDNLLRAHARNPYEGERRLFVAIGGVVSSGSLSGQPVATA